MSDYDVIVVGAGSPGEHCAGALDVEAALASSDFMVSKYSDAGQEHWLAAHGIDLLRGHGRLAGTGVVPPTHTPTPRATGFSRCSATVSA